MFVGYRDRPTRYLELGVFEGRSLRWMAQHILVHPESSAVAIDSWTGLERRYGKPKDIEALARKNLLPYKEKVRFINGILPQALEAIAGQKFDIIYVDDGHQPDHCYEVTKAVWPMLAPGGHIGWDDYEGFPYPPNHPLVKEGVERFLSEIPQDSHQDVIKGVVRWIRKA